MIKVVKNKKHIPLVKIKQMEEDGIDALERFKFKMAVDMVYNMPKELFSKLFKTIVTNPNDIKCYKKALSSCGEQPTNYNKERVRKFKELEAKQVAEIEMKLEIDDYEETKES